MGIRAWFLALGAALACTSCGGPCEHIYKDPLLIVGEATGSGGQQLSQLLVEEVRFEGVVSRQIEDYAQAPSFGVTVSAGGLLCNVRCGFATEEGVYDIRVSAPGYAASVIHVSARYRDFDGGCPSSNAGGTTLVISLLAK